MRLVPTEQLFEKTFGRGAMGHSAEIDAVLHVHIATDRQYQDDCQILFGGFVHHAAGLGTRADRAEWLEVFARTKQLFEKTFGRGAMGHSAPAACEILLAFN